MAGDTDWDIAWRKEIKEEEERKKPLWHSLLGLALVYAFLRLIGRAELMHRLLLMGWMLLATLLILTFPIAWTIFWIAQVWKRKWTAADISRLLGSVIFLIAPSWALCAWLLHDPVARYWSLRVAMGIVAAVVAGFWAWTLAKAAADAWRRRPS